MVDYERTEAAALAVIHREFFAGRLGLAGFTAAFRARNSELWAAYRRHETALEDLRTERFRRLLREYGAGADTAAADIAARYERELSRRARLFPDSLPALRALRAVARLILVTDGIAAVQHAKLRTTRLRGLFEHVVISAEVGHRKPDPALLEDALARAGVGPAAALMVGDSPGSDGAAAAAAGIDFCWVNRRGPGTGQPPPARPAGPAVPPPRGAAPAGTLPGPVTLRFEVPDLATLAACLSGQAVRRCQPGLAALPRAG